MERLRTGLQGAKRFLIRKLAKEKGTEYVKQSLLIPLCNQFERCLKVYLNNEAKRGVESGAYVYD